MPTSDFYNLNVWKNSHQLTVKVYELVKTFPNSERFGITDQLRRASSSVPANIAEGYGKYHRKDKIKFYLQARGSLKEVQSFLLLAKDLNYLKKEKLKSLWNISKDCEKLLNGLIRSQKNKR